MIQFISKKLLFLILVLGIVGCASLEKQIDTIKPTAEVIATRLIDINFEQVDLEFDVAVTNENPFSFKIAGVDYDLQIAGKSLVSGVTGKGIKIKKSAISKVALPVTLKFDDLKKLPGKIWESDEFVYQLLANINVNLPVIGNYSFPYEMKGELPVPKIPKVKLKNIDVKKLGLTSAELVAQVEIDNPNSFSLDLSDFNYQLNINGRSWGEGKSSISSSIPKKGKGTIGIPLELNLLSMGKTVYDLISGDQPIEYQLKGAMTVDTGLELLRNYRMPLDLKGQVLFN
ncbi:MAG: LEA14-like dessication related protein [Gammaproteobacteria bacterium]|jgi:LEA14-like dessication related protein